MPLTLADIRYVFGRRVVIDELFLELEDGEWLAVVGANGAGRSTLAEMAAGLRRPISGEILLDGQDIWGKDGQQARRRLGLVMQRAEDQFLGDTVFEDLAFGPRQTLEDEDEIEDRVRNALDLVDFDLEEVRERSPLGFSGGQRRRLAVAAIVALDPSVLILDEPFAGLDASARQEMADLLQRLRERRNTTILTFTSDLELIGRASRMALLVRGEIGLVGDLRDFVANQWLCREAGVMLPENIRLALELREKGWNVPVLGPDGALEAAIANEWLRRKRA
jgi:energy-coupling factor transport system ATP-binding protein